MHATPVRRTLHRPIDHLALGTAGGRAASRPPSADLRSFYELAAIVAGQPRRDPQPKSLKLPVALQLRRPATRGSGSRWHDDLFRSCLHTSWDKPPGATVPHSASRPSSSRDTAHRRHRLGGDPRARDRERSGTYGCCWVLIVLRVAGSRRTGVCRVSGGVGWALQYAARGTRAVGRVFRAWGGVNVL